MPNPRDDALRPSDVGKLTRLSRRVRQRLFAVDVFAGQQRGFRHLIMQAVRQADIDEIDVGIVDRNLPVLQNPGARGPGGEVFRGGGVRFDDRNHARGSA